MKKNILSLILSVAISICSTGVAFADTYSDLQMINNKIVSIETQIQQLQHSLQQYDLDIVTIFMGEVISTSPYFIVKGSNFGIESINGNWNYYIIQTPDSGVSGYGLYTGSFQVVGTQLVQIKGEWVEAVVLTDYPPEYAQKSDEISALQKELEQLQNQKEQLEIKINQERYLPPTWAKETIENAINKNAVPDEICIDYQKPITRAEFCKALIMGIKAEYDQIDTETEPSVLTYIYDANDVQFNDYNDYFITLAARTGIVSGGLDGKFYPNDYVTREQAATMIVRTLKSMGFTVPTGNPEVFSDLGQSSSYAVKDIQQITAFKTNGISIMLGMNQNEFVPKDNFTRAQAIVTIQRLLDYTKSEEAISKQWEQAYSNPLGKYVGEYESGDFWIGLYTSSTGEYRLNVQKNKYKEDGTWDVLNFSNSDILKVNGNSAVASYTDDYGNKGEMIFEFGDTCWITVTVTEKNNNETLEMIRTQVNIMNDVG